MKIYKLIIVVLLILLSYPDLSKAETTSMLLNETQIAQELQTLDRWTTNGKEITKTYQFKDFLMAIAFVNSLVEPAEKAGHHPDIAISYNKVTITMTTHDAGGLTQKDFDLARIIAQLAEK